MFIDASALTAMLTDEADARAFAARMKSDARRLTSPLAVWETVLAVARALGLSFPDAQAAVDEALDLFGIQVLAVPPQAAAVAVTAFDRYGKGRHPAALNFGDCFAYAAARYYRQPLLYKGDDFPRTDIEAA